MISDKYLEKEYEGTPLIISLNQYQQESKKTAIYPVIGGNPSMYPMLGLVNEAGEVAGKVKKLHRDEKAQITLAFKEALAKEIGDVAWYLAQLCSDAGIMIEGYSMAAYEQERVITQLGMGPTISAHAVDLNLHCGRLASCYKMAVNSETLPMSSATKEGAKDILGIIMYHFDSLCDFTGFTPLEVCQMNLFKLFKRKDEGTLKGDGDDR